MFAHFSKAHNKEDKGSDAEGDEETEERKDKKSGKINQLYSIIGTKFDTESKENYEEMEAEDIKVVPKGMKIRVKRNTKPDKYKDTLKEEILVPREFEDSPRHHNKRDQG